MTALINSIATLRPLPEIWHAHWLLRLPLALVMIHQAMMKFPLSADDAAAFSLPFILWAMSAYGELLAAAGLIVGGLLANRLGDIVTRLAGFAIAGVVAGVLYVVYWAPLADLVISNQFHILLLAGGLFFLLRGNERRLA
ncbi:MAG: hypothetical protein MUC58_07615 [Rhizobiaceae bacterium]|jgi:hypothetical protein|nr:hypothetical protein [Rhizobiaceae bacterium]